MFGFLKKKKKTLEKPTQNEERSHHRYHMEQFLNGFVHIQNQPTFSLLDLSYGGLAVHTNGQKIPLNKYFDAEIRILNKTQRVQIKFLYQIGDKVGGCFNHDHHGSITFLVEIIQFIEFGRSLLAVDRKYLKETYQNENITYYRGQGPTDLVVKKLDPHQLDVFITYKLDESYRTFEFRSGEIRTFASIEISCLSQGTAQMLPDQGIDQHVLTHIIYLLSGITDSKVSKVLSPVYLACVAALDEPMLANTAKVPHHKC